jgi:hypothetical protein
MERRGRVPVLSVLLVAAGVAAPAAARVLQTRDAALHRIFGAGARLEPRVAWLTPALADSVAALARTPCKPTAVTYWVATRGDSILGRAYLDTRTVRTMPATLLVAVGHHAVVAVEILAFHEPQDYLPPRRWLERLRGRSLPARLRGGDDVDAISGATLSVAAATAAVRLALALDRLVGAAP